MKKKKKNIKELEPAEDENKDYRIASIKRYQDIMGSDDEFESGKDKVFLNGNGSSDEDDDFLNVTDQEVLRIDTESFDEKSDNDISKHSYNSEEEENDNLQNWGTSKKTYYNADSLSEEEDAFEEEKEALRLQKLHLSKLKESDFIDDLEEWKSQDINEHTNLINQTQIVTETLQHDIPDNLSDEDTMTFLKKMYPEFILLSEEYQYLFPLLNPLKELYEKVSGPRMKRVQQKFFSLSTYLGVLAMYFSIISDPDKDIVSMKDHPIMISLMRCKKLWEMAKDINTDVIETDIETQLEKPNSTKKELVTNIHKKKKKKTVKDIKPETEEKSKQHYDSLNISDIEKSFLSVKNISDELKDDYKEQDSHETLDINGENIKKKSIKFYVAQINQKSGKKVRFLNSGDTDLPYPEPKKEHIMNSKKTKVEIDENDSFLELESDQQSDDSDEKYYNMLLESNKKRKLEKKENYDMERKREKQALMDESEIVNGKREIGYDIEKNKGLLPYRAKEVRNPRVKKRKKYEAAKKKLASKVAIYKGVPKNAYKGEATVNQEEVIIIEVILSLVIFCIERVLYSGELQPINHSEYVSMKHKSDDVITSILTYRPGFIDIRQKRKLYEQSKMKSK
ncbi:hypothetical protein PORY_002185 [Pneumocystis oryctolagi]|uniref:Uncharacterized protein n=1 Tax=Pneumocystis oryctolagi TaxID=42067 RepID=A0ACB7CAH8_9ASCO|nr:hypothetical protein PORY_002185 [Pneumocystis oryctolagi]